MDKNQPFLTKMLQHMGYMVRADISAENVGWNTIDDIGRSDVIAIKKGKVIAIEAKRGEDSILMVTNENDENGWKLKQQRWAKRCELFDVPYWLYFTMGTAMPHLKANKYKIKRSWLFPASIGFEIVEMLRPIQKSLPYSLSKNSKKELKDLNLCAINYLKDYELKWYGSGKLVRPMLHRNEEEKKYGDNSPVIKYGSFWLPESGHPFYDIIK